MPTQLVSSQSGYHLTRCVQVMTPEIDTLSVAGIWTAVEVNMAIVCACLPTLPHLFRHWYDGKQPDQSMKSTGSFLGRKMVGWMKFSKSRKSN